MSNASTRRGGQLEGPSRSGSKKSSQPTRTWYMTRAIPDPGPGIPVTSMGGDFKRTAEQGKSHDDHTDEHGHSGASGARPGPRPARSDGYPSEGFRVGRSGLLNRSRTATKSRPGKAAGPGVNGRGTQREKGGTTTPHRVDIGAREIRRADGLIAKKPQDFYCRTPSGTTSRRQQGGTAGRRVPTRMVSESALTTRIKALRKALGDDGRTQGTIRTAPRRGFRFVAHLEDAKPPLAPTSASTQQIQGASSPARLTHSIGFCRAAGGDPPRIRHDG